jgi:hypothetical protein
MIAPHLSSGGGRHLFNAQLRYYLVPCLPVYSGRGWGRPLSVPIYKYVYAIKDVTAHLYGKIGWKDGGIYLPPSPSTGSTTTLVFAFLVLTPSSLLPSAGDIKCLSCRLLLVLI